MVMLWLRHYRKKNKTFYEYFYLFVVALIFLMKKLNKNEITTHRWRYVSSSSVVPIPKRECNTRERFERVEMSVAKIDLVEGLELIERCFGNSHA